MPNGKSEPRMFELGDILSITTGVLVSRRHMDGVYDILDFMTGANLFTHQLPGACKACKPVLLLQYPQLTEVNADWITPATWKEAGDAWLVAQEAKHGSHLHVRPLESYAQQNPILELEDMLGKGVDNA